MRRTVVLVILVGFMVIAGIVIGTRTITYFKEVYVPHNQGLAVAQQELLDK
tara:strand:- start:543 stop:695 length:153 start_codon:yes stop_codon:yes gene_type:complete